MPSRVNGSWVSGPLVDRMTADAVPSWGRTYQSQGPKPCDQVRCPIGRLVLAVSPPDDHSEMVGESARWRMGPTASCSRARLDDGNGQRAKKRGGLLLINNV